MHIGSGGEQRKKLQQEIRVLDGALGSRYELLHGEPGISQALMDTFHMLAEVRIKIEYGDYFAVNTTKLKNYTIDDLTWKGTKEDWQKVARKLEQEEKVYESLRPDERYKAAQLYHKDVKRMADHLECSEDLIMCQIQQYAERNAFVHSGIGEMIEAGKWQELAEHIVRDKAIIARIYKCRPQEHKKAQESIELVEREWFRAIKPRPDRSIQWFVSAKILKRLERETAQLAAADGGTVP